MTQWRCHEGMTREESIFYRGPLCQLQTHRFWIQCCTLILRGVEFPEDTWEKQSVSIANGFTHPDDGLAGQPLFPLPLRQ